MMYEVREITKISLVAGAIVAGLEFLSVVRSQEPGVDYESYAAYLGQHEPNLHLDGQVYHNALELDNPAGDAQIYLLGVSNSEECTENVKRFIANVKPDSIVLQFPDDTQDMLDVQIALKADQVKRPRPPRKWGNLSQKVTAKLGDVSPAWAKEHKEKDFQRTKVNVPTWQNLRPLLSVHINDILGPYMAAKNSEAKLYFVDSGQVSLWLDWPTLYNIFSDSLQQGVITFFRAIGGHTKRPEPFGMDYFVDKYNATTDELWLSPATIKEDLDKMMAVRYVFHHYFPRTTKATILEREHFFVDKLRQIQGEKILALVGTGHLHGMRYLWEQDS